ncbi:MAG: hypothetical protein LC104_14380, partial [Bacteroidales bacterium]|nr:hypothetical protein [Bacteroidales bacterium]
MADTHSTHTAHDDDNHGHGPPGAKLDAVQQGHESDTFGVRAVLYVPMFVVAVLMFTYILVTIVVGFAYRADRMTPAGNEPLAERNREKINARFERISSTDEAAAVKQPRLEFLRVDQEISQNRLTAPAHARSKIPTADNNAPVYRPESLHPENYIDPQTGSRILIEYQALPGSNKNVARIPIMIAMVLAAEQNLLPVRKDPVRVAHTSAEAAKLSNGGLGVTGSPVGGHAVHDDHGHKHPEIKLAPKPEPEKKPEPKPAVKPEPEKKPEPKPAVKPEPEKK